jgi:hypothetical protein
VALQSCAFFRSWRFSCGNLNFAAIQAEAAIS